MKKLCYLFALLAMSCTLLTACYYGNEKEEEEPSSTDVTILETDNQIVGFYIDRIPAAGVSLENRIYADFDESGLCTKAACHTTYPDEYIAQEVYSSLQGDAMFSLDGKIIISDISAIMRGLSKEETKQVMKKMPSTLAGGRYQGTSLKMYVSPRL
ncbi:MAG: hypothetical protein J6Y82_12950 [Bacteroidales bacterium]|nr:hypothetical protein [Bacteroidales bacterium]